MPDEVARLTCRSPAASVCVIVTHQREVGEQAPVTHIHIHTRYHQEKPHRISRMWSRPSLARQLCLLPRATLPSPSIIHVWPCGMHLSRLAVSRIGAAASPRVPRAQAMRLYPVKAIFEFRERRQRNPILCVFLTSLGLPRPEARVWGGTASNGSTQAPGLPWLPDRREAAFIR